MVLNGSQEGLFIAAYLFIEAGDRVVVSEPTYSGAISAFESFGAGFVSVPLDAAGSAAAEPLPRYEAARRWLTDSDAGSLLAERFDLVFHQRNQRRDDDAATIAQ